MASLGDELPNEINRVRRVQGRYKELRGMPNVMVEPQIAMMEESIQAAIKAAASGDAVEMLRCLVDLKTWEK